MDRVLELARRRLTVIVGVGGVLGLGVLAVGPLLPETPEVGALEPLLATSAEETRVEVLSSGSTFGGILQQTALSNTDRQGLRPRPAAAGPGAVSRTRQRPGERG